MTDTLNPVRDETVDTPGGVPPQPAGLSARGWVLALLAQTAILMWVVRTEITARVFVSSWTLSMPGIILLLALLARNAARGRRAFSRTEMLAAYVAVSGTVTLAGYNFFQVLIPTLATGMYLQTPENRWGQVLRYLPAWLLPSDREALKGIFRGESAVPWQPWLPALAAWGSLVLALVFASLALNALLADVWIRKERLAFPIATLPLEMTRGDSPLFRNRIMWLGFLIPVVLNSLMALNYYSPSIPAITLRHQDVLEGVTTAPWSLLRPINVGFTPFIAGLAYLAPLDVSFSVWFFQWVGKSQRLAAFSLGMIDAGASRGAPFLNEQTVGAFLAMGAMVVIKSWPRRRLEKENEGTQDPALDRLLRVVLAVALVYVVGFMLAAGFSPALAATLLALYFLTVIVLSRVRAEAGFAWAYGPERGSSTISHIVTAVHGTVGMAEKDLALMGFFHWLWWDLRFSLMPAQMEALKIGDAAHIRRRQLLTVLAAASVVAVVVGMAWVLQDSYRLGWGTAKTYFGPAAGARQSYTMSANWLRNRAFPQWDRTLWMGVGAAVTVLLVALRQRFAWWPFHPIGYVMAGTPTSVAFWWYYFMAWGLKLLVLRYGGMRLYRISLPFVFGLIMGDVASQTLWSLAGVLLDIPIYTFVT